MSTSEWNAGRERRLSPRVNLLMELKGDLIALDEPATVQQLSLRGMTVHTNVPLGPNGAHEFRLHHRRRHAGRQDPRGPQPGGRRAR